MKRRLWTPGELERLRELYPDRPTSQVAETLRRPLEAVYRAAAKLGVHKSLAFLQSAASGILRKGETRPGCIATQFKKGQTPANKGLRRPGWAPGRMKETQFKKGERGGRAALNWRPIGTVLPDPDGYLRIKVREAVYGKEPSGFGNQGCWPFLSRVVWQQHKGPIPPGKVIVFKNGKREDCAIDNLECVTRSELARRNNIWTRYPRELAEAIQLNGALQRTIRRRLGDGQKQNAGPA